MRTETILYTTLVGDYDELTEHDHPRDLSFCFTDRKGTSSKSWQLIPIEDRLDTIDQRIRVARFFKTQPHNVLPAHRYSIWVDASMRISGPIHRAVEHLGNRSVATFKYPDIYGTRTCAFDEALACIRRGKDGLDIIMDQMERYRLNDFPENFGLAETTIMVRENTRRVSLFNDSWWSEICDGSRRDQLSFDYTCWRLGMEYSWLPGYRLKNSFAMYSRHKADVYPGRPFISTDDRCESFRGVTQQCFMK